MKKVIVIVLLFLAISAAGQERIGLKTSRYSGIYGNSLNPSAFNSGALRWDFNIIGGGFFYNTDYFYIENSNLIHAAANSSSLTYRNTDPEKNTNPSALYYSFNDATRDMDNTFNAFLSLPSFSCRFKKFSIGIFSNFRIANGANNLDKDLDNSSIEQWTRFETKFFDKMDAAGLVWGEVGLNIGFLLAKNRNKQIHFGFNLKYLAGTDGFYADLQERSRAEGLTESLQLVNGGPFEYGFATGMDGDNSGYSPSINGSGFGLDIGVTSILASHDERPYAWKLGAAILDIGYIDFHSNAQRHYIPQGDNYQINYDQIINSSTINDLTVNASNQIFGNPTQSLIGNEISVFTPMALSLQGDYSVNSNWYVGMLVIRRLDFSPRTVERENVWMGSIRYETKKVEFGSHLMLYNDINLRIGGWIRLGPLTLGSDHLTSLFIKQAQFNSSDFYFALRIYPFKKGKSAKNRYEICNFKR